MALQPISSDVSEQSLSPSHFQEFGMHCFEVAHWNSPDLQVAGGLGLEQVSSSELSLQSSSPSQRHRDDIHRPLVQRN